MKKKLSHKKDYQIYGHREVKEKNNFLCKFIVVYCK